MNGAISFVKLTRRKKSILMMILKYIDFCRNECYSVWSLLDRVDGWLFK